MDVDLGVGVGCGGVVAAGLGGLGGGWGEECPLGLLVLGGRESPESAVFVESGHRGAAAAGEDVEGLLEGG